MLIPCGQCIGCRLERSRQWALRCVHEAKDHDKNCFITLTYDPKFLPKTGTLVKKDLQLFMKRLRKKYGEKIRFFACGEYGDKGERPHYHACIFNHDFEDKTLWSVRGEVNLYKSEELQKLWPFGFSTVGEVTFESAAYVARYCTKKITGEAAEEHYKGKIPEFVNMSRRPGIGRIHYDRYYKDIYSIDGVVRNGLKLRPPKYYDKLYDAQFPQKMKEVKDKRIKNHNDSEMQWYRLKCKERKLNRKFKQLIRGFENEKSVCNP